MFSPINHPVNQRKGRIWSKAAINGKNLLLLLNTNSEKKNNGLEYI
jgi:hypothetical protein